jgi:eukaryotic-like serine/threonine-protein kinase
MADAHPARRAHTPWPRDTQNPTDGANAPAARGVAPLFVVPPKGVDLDLDLGFDDATAPAVPHTPEAWGPYRVTRLLGQGRLGAVYEAFADAQQATAARAVALHVLPLDTDPLRRAALEPLFTQAVQQAATLSHPHLAQVHGAAAVEQGVYMACEWLQGRSLSAAWQAGWRANPVEAALLVSRLADGLAHAHARGVVHGGISPGTVFLTEGGQPKLLGMGWAAAASASNLPELDPLVAGTAHYLAPEQLQGGAVDARTDVHTLGALLFELLAARQAFAGNTVPQVVQALQKHAPLAPHLGSPSVPQRLSEIAMRALEREPADRYPSAAALSADLQDWLRSVNVPTASTGAAAAAAATSTHKRRWLAAALAATACAAVALTLVDRQPPAQPAAPTFPTAPAAPISPAAGEPVAATNPAPPSAPPAGPQQQPLLPAPSLQPAAPAAAGQEAGAAMAAAVPPAEAPPLATTPAAAAVASKAAPSGAKTAPVVATVKTAAVAANVKTAALAAGAKTAAALAGAAPVAQAVVNFAISPWGQVEVNGKAMGASPPLTSLTLPEGVHQVVVRNSDAPPFSTTVQVSADQPTTVRHRFAP